MMWHVDGREEEKGKAEDGRLGVPKPCVIMKGVVAWGALEPLGRSIGQPTHLTCSRARRTRSGPSMENTVV